METKFSEYLLNLHESLLRAQLNVIRQLRKEAGLQELDKPKKGMSQMDMVYYILEQAQQPMHVNEIIAIAKERFDVKLDKESVVSALTKRIKRKDRFIKTAPNTFALIVQEHEGARK
jgi:hypothetical protein